MQQKETQETPYCFSEIDLLYYPYPKKMTLRYRVKSFFRRVGKRWDKAKKRFLIQHNVWRGGNLLILLITFSVLAFTLAFSVGSVLTVGILPVWGLILLLGGALLVLWNIGALYQARLKQIAAYPPLEWEDPILEENREKAERNVWEQHDRLFPLVQEIPEKNGSYPPSDEETSEDKTRQNTVWYPIYSAYVFNEPLLKAYGEDNENKSSEQRESLAFSLLNKPSNRSPATSDEETSDDKTGQNSPEQNALLPGGHLEDESQPGERLESLPFLFRQIPQQNSPSATSDDETSDEETPEDDTCQNTFQVR